ncbi:hypothetical protein D3C85_1645960 [compost metagenome]
MALVVSVVALARATAFALEAEACSRKDEKSLVLGGWRTEPTTLPPAPATDLAVSAASAWPNAKSAASTYQFLSPFWVRRAGSALPNM